MRGFVRLTASVWVAVTLTFTPYLLEFDQAGRLRVELAAAHAKDGNNGNGNGKGGNGNGNGNGNGRQRQREINRHTAELVPVSQ